MDEALVRVTHVVEFVIDLMALVIIAFGAIEAFVTATRMVFERGTPRGDERRAIWIRFARWLIAGLTFQLAADIVGTAIAPTWDEIGRLAAIAVIRTFLNYFLERDMIDVRERQHSGAHAIEPEHACPKGER